MMERNLLALTYYKKTVQAPKCDKTAHDKLVKKFHKML